MTVCDIWKATTLADALDTAVGTVHACGAVLRTKYAANLAPPAWEDEE